jgi:hypothetical protein
VVLVLQQPEHLDEVLAEACALARTERCRLTIVGMPQEVTFVYVWAALSGVTTLQCVQNDAVKEAAELARHAASEVPADVAVEHHAATGWRCSCFLDALRSGRCEAVLLAAMPSRARDRRALTTAAREGEARLVCPGAPEPAAEAVLGSGGRRRLWAGWSPS